ncbi:MAG: GIY-YIG nuclease family protein [Candidatus Methanodesulfokora sp.]
MRGAYILILKNSEDVSLRVGSLGPINLRRGFYAYIGSARSGIERRIRRYLEGPSKVRWHIDYLVTAPSFRVEKVIKIGGGDEVEIARRISKVLPGIEKFGSSDDRENRSHLFFSESDPLHLLLDIIRDYKNVEIVSTQSY